MVLQGIKQYHTSKRHAVEGPTLVRLRVQLLNDLTVVIEYCLQPALAL